MPGMLPDATPMVGSSALRQAAHVVLVPFPAPGHVAPLMQLACLLLGRGARVTFVHTQYNYRRVVEAKGEAAVRPATTAPGFRVEVIDDGIPLSVPFQDLPVLVDSIERNCPHTFRALLRRLGQEAEDEGTPPVTCVVADVVMPFAPAAAREAGIPDVPFFTASACGLMGYLQFAELIKRGLVPFKGILYIALVFKLHSAFRSIRLYYISTTLKDASLLTDDGYLDTPLAWVPGMRNMRLRDIPALCRTTNPDDVVVSAVLQHLEIAVGSKAIIVNTLYELEKAVVDSLATFFPRLYTVGPLAEVIASAGGSGSDDAAHAAGLGAMDISVWQEDRKCLSWLDGKPAGSVVYVNFGSVAVMTAAQARELALGLARCGSPFLWAKRPDVVDGDDGEGEEAAAPLPEAFLDAVARGGGLVVPWCPQAAVLKHAAVGLFVTHCGWNSLLEAVAAGQPVLGWPSIAEQTTNCRQVSECWGNGAELPREMESGAVAGLVREMMAGDLGKEKRAKAAEWKAVAEAAVVKGGASWGDVDRLMEDLLQLAAGSK